MTAERERAAQLLIHVLQGDSWGLQEVVFDVFTPGKGASEALGAAVCGHGCGDRVADSGCCA